MACNVLTPVRCAVQPTQPPSFLDSDPASVLRNVGVPPQAEREVKTRAKQPVSASAETATIAEKTDTSKTDSYSDSDLGRYSETRNHLVTAGRNSQGRLVQQLGHRQELALLRVYHLCMPVGCQEIFSIW